jgi:ABC-type Mn2+/Zn2+ transport system ATPase subunit
VLLLKRRSIAFGPVDEVFSERNLEAAFGPVEHSGKVVA